MMVMPVYHLLCIRRGEEEDDFRPKSWFDEPVDPNPIPIKDILVRFFITIDTCLIDTSLIYIRTESLISAHSSPLLLQRY